MKNLKNAFGWITLLTIVTMGTTYANASSGLLISDATGVTTAGATGVTTAGATGVTTAGVTGVTTAGVTGVTTAGATSTTTDSSVDTGNPCQTSNKSYFAGFQRFFADLFQVEDSSGECGLIITD